MHSFLEIFFSQYLPVCPEEADQLFEQKQTLFRSDALIVLNFFSNLFESGVSYMVEEMIHFIFR